MPALSASQAALVLAAATFSTLAHAAPASSPTEVQPLRFARDIINGDVAPTDVPYFTSILTVSGQQCGGTLVAPQWVLTAAHCLLNGTDMITEPKTVLHINGSYGGEMIFRIPNYRISFGNDSPMIASGMISEEEAQALLDNAGESG